jgi:hypothetical protein
MNAKNFLANILADVEILNAKLFLQMPGLAPHAK